VLLGNGDGTFANNLDYATGTGPDATAVADFNGDGRPDIVTADGGSGTVSVLLNTTHARDWSSETAVSATVKPTITVVKAPDAISFPPLNEGEKSQSPEEPLVIKTNDAYGYQFSVTRTAFSGGDIPLLIGLSAPSNGTKKISGATQIDPTQALPLGARTGSASATSGDTWMARLTLGPVPHVNAGVHTTTLTFTVVGL
jgi:hypothetical protein